MVVPVRLRPQSLSPTSWVKRVKRLSMLVVCCIGLIFLFCSLQHLFCSMAAAAAVLAICQFQDNGTIGAVPNQFFAGVLLRKIICLVFQLEYLSKACRLKYQIKSIKKICKKSTVVSSPIYASNGVKRKVMRTFRE